MFMEIKFKRLLFAGIQIIGVCAFILMAASSASNKSSYREAARGAVVGAAAGHEGYIFIGNVSSQSEVESLAKSKGYAYYIWDSVNGNVYAK